MMVITLAETTEYSFQNLSDNIENHYKNDKFSHILYYVCQMEKGYAHELRLETEVSGNQEGGILVWHTGTPGTGGWLATL